MSATIKMVIVAVVLVAALGVLAMKQQPTKVMTDAQPHVTTATDVAAEPTTASLPRLIDLGAGKCIPCKMMMPILDQLRDDFSGQFEVTIIDISEDRAAGDAYGVHIIPTQIFFDANGNELFRHEGFYSRDEILDKWRELGFALEAASISGAGS